MKNNPNNQENGYWDYSENLYTKIGDKYEPVTMTRTDGSNSDRHYMYHLPDGTTIDGGKRNESPNLGITLYQLVSVDESQNVYTYTYTDADGATRTIGISTGADTRFETTLYERIVSNNGGGSRIDALKTALNSFTAAVNEKAVGKDGAIGTADDIKHRIAVVGFSSPEYNNTELLTGVEITQGNGVQMGQLRMFSIKRHFNS